MEDDTLTAEEQAFIDSQGESGLTDNGGGQPQGDQTGAQGADDASAQQQPNGEQGAQAKKPPQQVPLATFLEEKNRRKELEEQNKTLMRRTDLILERTFGAQQQQQQPQPKVDEPKAPNPQDDPFGYLVHEISGLKQKQGEGDQQFRARQETEQRAAVIQQLQTASVAMEEEYKRGVPDYDAAVGHLRSVQEAQFTAMGYDAVQVRQMIAQSAVGVAARAIQMGQNPADILYRMAKASGYVAKPVDGQQQQQQQQNGNDVTQQNGNGQTAQQRIDTAKRGQQQAQSLSTTRGSAPTGMTAQRLASMSEAEFAKAMEDPRNLQYLGD